MTIFHLLAIVLAVVGLIQGMQLGARYFGGVGAFGGALLGAYVGLLCGWLPGVLGFHWLLRGIRRKTTQELRLILGGDKASDFNLALTALRIRGEDIQRERTRVVALLASDSYECRKNGWSLLQRFYPDVAGQISDYRPTDSIEICRRKAEAVPGAGQSENRA